MRKIDTQRFLSEYGSQFGTVLLKPSREALEFLLKELAKDSRLPEDANLFVRYASYILATVKHETDNTFRPVREYGRGKGKSYGDSGFWGRGYVPLTHDYNYLTASKKLDSLLREIDSSLTWGSQLVESPDLALNPEVAYQVCVLGMTEGWFTGKKLSTYITASPKSNRAGLQEYINSRRVISGTDKASLVASHAAKFEELLRRTLTGGEGVSEVAVTNNPVPPESKVEDTSRKEVPAKVDAVLGAQPKAVNTSVLNKLKTSTTLLEGLVIEAGAALTGAVTFFSRTQHKVVIMAILASVILISYGIYSWREAQRDKHR
jgi:hypothetical protein